jgi:hypothetical protein
VKAGMKSVSDDELSGADFLLSIVPSAEALSLAERLSPDGPIGAASVAQ